MKKTIKIAMVAVVAAVAGVGIYSSQKADVTSDIMLANVEALAQGENPLCPYGCVAGGSGCLCYTWYPTYKDGPH